MQSSDQFYLLFFEDTSVYLTGVKQHNSEKGLLLLINLFRSISYLKKNINPVNHLYILSKGKVAAVNKKDGSIVWEIKLKEYHKNSNGYNYGQISVEAGKIFVASSGILFCLSEKDGSLVWVNELKGGGYNFISMAAVANESAAAASAAIQAAVTAAVITTAT